MLLQMAGGKREGQPVKRGFGGLDLGDAETVARACGRAHVGWDETWRRIRPCLPAAIECSQETIYRVHRHLIGVWISARLPPDRGPEPWWEDDRRLSQAGDAKKNTGAGEGLVDETPGSC